MYLHVEQKMSIVGRLQQTSIQSDCSEIDSNDDLPELSSCVQSPGMTHVQVGDIILLRPKRLKGRWPGLVKFIRPKEKSSKSKNSFLPEPRKTLRSKSLPIEEDFTYSHDFLTIHLLNFPIPERIQQEIKPRSRVELYLSHKQDAVISEWQKHANAAFITNLFKAFEEAETYLRKRIVQTLAPGTAVEQYMQVKRSRLDFDFEGIEHTDQDKHLRLGDITSNNLESIDNGAPPDFLNSYVEPDDSDLSNSNLETTEELKPCLTPEEFVCLTERIECCKELLRAIYLGKRYSVKHKTYFCNNRRDKKLLKQDYLSSFDHIPYRLDNAQKTELHDIVLDFANSFVENNPREEIFSIPTYAYDVLLPECTNWLMVELESHPLIFIDVN